MDTDRLTTDTFEQAVEALVFASDVPLCADDVARAYDDVTGHETTPEDVSAAVETLNGRYRERGAAFRVYEWGGGYRLATIEEMAPFVKSLFTREEERRLSRSLLETLAIVAYRQPVTKPEIDHVRGVGSDYAIRGLIDRNLVRITGRSESVGRPLLYGTTETFLDQFGLDALDALPQPREIEDLLADPAFSAERARLLADRGLTLTDVSSSGLADGAAADDLSTSSD